VTQTQLGMIISRITVTVHLENLSGTQLIGNIFFNWGSAEPKGSASGIQGFRGTACAQ